MDGKFYGTTQFGGSHGLGAIFNVSPFEPLALNKVIDFTPDTGTQPVGSLIRIGEWLYGTCSSGGNANQGTIFRLNSDGSNFEAIYHFTQFPLDGSSPQSGLVAGSNGSIYGTTPSGGEFGKVFLG